jgi:L-threonylcarbamoyladenylate synthase
VAPPSPADLSRADIDAAAAALRAGRLVAFPTETVYGLGADAGSEEAVRRLFAVKRRPADHPVIVHLAAGAPLDAYARDVPEAARRLAARFWPGPLTIVLRRRPDRVAGAATGGRDTVGLRVPDHPVALALLETFGGGVAAPSANRFGRVSPTAAEHVRADLGHDVDVVLDGGPCAVGVESTIVDLSGGAPALLRVGRVTAEQLASVLGRPVAHLTRGEVPAPGTLAAHYAPRARVEVCDAAAVPARAAAHAGAGRTVAVLAPFPPPDVPLGTHVLDAPRGADEYARVLYARLREADQRGVDVLLAVPPPGTGVAAAVRDRLCRAARG